MIRGKLAIFFICVCFFAGCGYTQKVTLPNNIRTIAIPTFEDQIPPKERFTYQPGVEITLTNAIRKRFIFDGNLKVVEEERADAILKGAIIAYSQEAVRYDNLESVEEYRLFLTVKFELVDKRTGEVIISESSFAGRSEYFTSQNAADMRKNAATDSVADLARNIVDRIIEEW